MSSSALYIHIPFCRSRCIYCDFYSVALSCRGDDTSQTQDVSNRYVEALRNEWLARHHEFPAPRTIYFGGGTPSLLPVEAVEQLGCWLPKVEGEFTVEVNPDDVTANLLSAWSSIGANRVSMGVQSFSDNELQKVRRRHSATQALRAYSLIRTLFSNVSIDIIIGLPGQTIDSLRQTLSTAISLRPEHISIYILTYEPGTTLTRLRSMRQITETPEDVIVSMYNTACELLGNAGYLHYEISNFALPGYEAQHNSSYWDPSTPYLGLGPGAHSYNGLCDRQANDTSLSAYLEYWGTEAVRQRDSDCVGQTNGDRSKLPWTVVTENLRERTNSTILTRLRTAKGLSLTNDIPSELLPEFLRSLQDLPSDRVVITSNTVSIPESGWLLSDDTIARLLFV